MPLFFVLINSDLGGKDILEKEIKNALHKVDIEYISTYGVYDALVKINDKNEDPRSLHDKLKTIPKVHSTLILTVC
jgi:adenylyl- and sulfurtransferase ThiI